jgi:RNA polymerase sigma-70 factor, ECF subfamily
LPGIRAIEEVMATADKELWARVKTGDEEAFGVLFDRHAERVYNYCFRRTADWAAAEDMVSAVFLEAWRRRLELELTSQDERLLPWLLGVATNLLRRRHRSKARLARALARLDPRPQEADLADDALGRIADEQRMAAVLRSLRALSKGERDVLALYAWAGLSYKEVAAALGVPVGTVRSRLSRARLHLQTTPVAALPRKREVTNEAH